MSRKEYPERYYCLPLTMTKDMYFQIVSPAALVVNPALRLERIRLK
jgi:hypothetical protein